MALTVHHNVTGDIESYLGYIRDRKGTHFCPAIQVFFFQSVNSPFLTQYRKHGGVSMLAK